MSASATEKQVRIAAQLYDARDTVRRLLGEHYRRRMRDIGDQLTQIAADRPLLSVAGEVAKGAPNAWDQLLVLAAAVEMVEPTTEVPA